MISFIPNEIKQTQEQSKADSDDDEDEMAPGEFIFLLDRSGSMKVE